MLSGANANSPFSAHQDVLGASVPSDADGRRRLVDELKNRGRGAVQAGQWPDAEALYTKALECCPDDSTKPQRAILCANLALVHGKMNRWNDAQTRAQEAVAADATYTKGWWRLGQAQAALEKFDKAVASLESAASLEPSNKALRKELDKLRVKAMEYANRPKDDEMDTTTTTTTTTAVPPPKTTTTAPKPKAASTTKTSSAVVDETFTKSEHVKGYKIVNGKKTSYFHNELSEEAAKLIGDIAPKKLDPGNASEPTAAGGAPAQEGTSAWNKAGTWEERDVTNWAKQELTLALMATQYTLPPSSPAPGAVVTTTKAEVVAGHASVAAVRGKKRYLYEISLRIEWEFVHNEITAKGSIDLPDVDGTCALGEGYDAANFVVKESDSASVRPVLDQFVHKQGWRDAVHETIDNWVRKFKDTY